MEGEPAPETKRLSQKTAVVMALVAGVTVANLYYNQPLLTQMGQTFGVGHKAGYIPAFTFVGLVLGMLLFVPLGDMFRHHAPQQRLQQWIVSAAEHQRVRR